MFALELALLPSAVGQTRRDPAGLAAWLVERAQPVLTSPTLAVAELQRVVLHHLGNNGSEDVQTFVYRVYLSSGARNGTEVRQGGHELASRQESRDVLPGALCATY